MPNWKKVIVSGSDASLNTLTVSNGITGSLFGTASYASQALLTTNIAGVRDRIFFNSATNTTTTSNELTWTDSINLLTLGSATGTAGTISKLALYTSSFGGYGFGVSPAQLDYVTDGSHVFYKKGVTPTELLRISSTGDVIITGSLAVGTSSLGASENTITLGARDNASEGGQIGFNAPGGTYTSASMIDNWQNKARILKGNNTTSTALVAQWDLHTTQMQLPAYTNASSFVGTATANLAVDSSGNVITVSTSGGSVFPYTGNAVITGSLTATTSVIAQANGAMYFRGGDDAELWDINTVNTIGVYGQQDQGVASIKLGSGGGILSGKSGSIGIGTINPTSASLTVNGNVWATSFTGSILGTASYASQALSSSFASTASYVTGSIFTNGNRALSASNALTASYVLNAVSASYAATASTTTAISGTQYYIPVFTTSNTLGNSVLIQSASNIGIGTSTARTKLNISSGDISAYNASGSGINLIGAQIYLGDSNFELAGYYNSAPGIGAVWSTVSGVPGDLALYTYNGFANNRLENMRLFKGGNVGIGTSITSSFRLDVSGSGRFTSDIYITGSLNVSSSSATNQIIGNTNLTTPATAGGTVNIVSLNNTPTLTFSQAGTAARLQITVIGGSQEQTHFKSNVSTGEFNWLNNTTNYLARLTTNGNLLLPGSGSTTQPVDAGYRLDVSGSARIRGYTNTSISSSLLVYGSGSAQPIFTVQGSQGELFSVTDSLSGSLFSVNDISGLPVIEAFSDNTILLGSYQAPALLTTNKVVLTASGNFILSTLPTASYDGAFYDYTARSGSNARAGSIMAIWGNGGTVNFTETTTTDFGSTAGLNLAVFVSGANMILTGSASTTAWTIKTIIRSI